MRVTSWWSPPYGQVLFGAESGGLGKSETCRSVKLVKPPSLDKCCSGCSC